MGGAAEVLGQWVEQEGHCVVGGAHCEPERTIALSTGDHWGGPALSSRFGGQPMAEAMGRMNYAATGLGNHDLDFGREQFADNMRKAAVPVIAANLKVEGPEGDGMRFPGHVVLERDGAKIGVVALTYVLGPQRSMAGRYDGLAISSYEEALAREVPAAWKAGSDAVVVLVDDCPRELAPIFEAHPEWKVSVVAGGHCDGPYQAKAGATTLVSPGRRFQQYLKATFTIDPAKPEGARLAGFDTALVPVTGASKPDARLAENLAQWKAKSEAQLGQQIGFTQAGLPLESAQLARWVTTALREATGADAALINKGGLRAGLPKGKVTVGDVYSALPFENSVMLVDLTGAQLIEALGNSEAVSDVTAAGKRFKDASGKGIDPARKLQGRDAGVPLLRGRRLRPGEGGIPSPPRRACSGSRRCSTGRASRTPTSASRSRRC